MPSGWSCLPFLWSAKSGGKFVPAQPTNRRKPLCSSSTLWPSWAYFSSSHPWSSDSPSFHHHCLLHHPHLQELCRLIPNQQWIRPISTTHAPMEAVRTVREVGLRDFCRRLIFTLAKLFKKLHEQLAFPIVHLVIDLLETFYKESLASSTIIPKDQRPIPDTTVGCPLGQSLCQMSGQRCPLCLRLPLPPHCLSTRCTIVKHFYVCSLASTILSRNK